MMETTTTTQTTPNNLTLTQCQSLTNSLEARSQALLDEQREIQAQLEVLANQRALANNWLVLRWIRKLDPTPLWQSAVESVYRRMQGHTITLNPFRMLRGINRYMYDWALGKVKEAALDQISHAAVIGMLLGNITPWSIGLYLTHLCARLNKSVGQIIDSLVSLIRQALEYGLSSLQKLLERMWKALCQVEQDAVPSGLDDEDSFTVESSEEVDRDGLAGIYDMLTSMIGAAIGTVQDVCLKDLIDIMGKCSKSIQNSVKGMKAVDYLYSKIQGWVITLVGCICPDKEMMDMMKGLNEHDFTIDGISVSSKEFVLEIAARSTVEKAETMKVDPAFMRSTQDMLDQGRIILASLEPGARRTFQQLISGLYSIRTAAGKQSTIPMKKFEPFFVTMDGAPGLGKSVATHMLIKAVSENLSRSKEAFGFPVDERYQTFAWNFGDNFVSGYNGQYIIYMDDLNKEKTPDAGSSARQIINLVSSVGVNIPGAGVDEKIMPFSSKMIFATTNNPYPNDQQLGLSEPKAFWRRRNLLIQCVPASIRDPVLNRAVAFKIRDPVVAGTYLESQLMSFTSLYNLVCVLYKRHYRDQQKVLDVDKWFASVEKDLTVFDERMDPPPHVGDSVVDVTEGNPGTSHDLLEPILAPQCASALNLRLVMEKMKTTQRQLDQGMLMSPMGASVEPSNGSYQDVHDCGHDEVYLEVDSSDEEDFRSDDPISDDDDVPPDVQHLIFGFDDNVRLKTAVYYVDVGRGKRSQLVLNANNPRGLITLLAGLSQSQTVIVGRYALTFEPLEVSAIQAYYRIFGFDTEAAEEFANKYGLRLSYPSEYYGRDHYNGFYCRGMESQWKDVRRSDGTEVEEGDPLFVGGFYAPDVIVPSGGIGGLNDGMKLRIRIQVWFEKVDKIMLGLGVTAVISAIVIVMNYSKKRPDAVPTYAASGLARSTTAYYGKVSPFAQKRSRNVHLISINSDVVTAFFYNARSLITVRHMFYRAKKGDKLQVSIGRETLDEEFDPANLEEITGTSDLIIYHCQNKLISPAPDSRKFFSNQIRKVAEEAEVVGAYSIVQRVAKLMRPYHYVDKAGNTYLQKEGLVTDGRSVEGSSGSLIICANKIVGIQVAVGTRDTRYEHITSGHLMSPDDLDETEVAHASSGTGLYFKKEADVMVSGNTKTAFVPSLISTLVCLTFGTKYEPAALKRNDPRLDHPGEEDLLIKAMNGYNHDFASIDKNLGRRVVEELRFEDKLTRPGSPRLLTEDEVINGSTEMNIKPFDVRTGPGLPWKNEPDIGKGKRKHIIGEVPDRTMSPELRDAFLNFDFDKTVLGYACLKDELRPLEKIKAGKTRSFVVLPMEYNLVLRKYFGAYVGVQHQECGKISSCVGINAYEDWDMIYARLAQYSMEWEDFDYGDWDRTLSPDWFELYADRVSNWYDDGLDNRDKRRKLMRQLAFADVQIGKQIFGTGGGNKSGCAITAEINTDIHEMLMIYCWFKLAKKHEPSLNSLAEFRDHNQLILYGDDQVKATRDAPWFNGNELEPLMVELGMKITPADKVGTVFTLKSPSEVTFLKRGFGARMACGKMMCPLNKDSIHKMLHWVRAKDDQKKALRMNVDCAIKEKFFHGKNEYDLFIEEIKRTCPGNVDPALTLKTWEDLYDEWIKNELISDNYW